jgi:hypothetical protein
MVFPSGKFDKTIPVPGMPGRQGSGGPADRRRAV